MYFVPAVVKVISLCNVHVCIGDGECIVYIVHVCIGGGA